MCSPSATSAIEPNARPPKISAIIIAVHSQITAQVLRSLRSWPAPRKLWECRKAAVPASVMTNPWQILALLQISTHHVEQLLRGVLFQRAGMRNLIDQVGANVILDHLGHQ